MAQEEGLVSYSTVLAPQGELDLLHCPGSTVNKPGLILTHDPAVSLPFGLSAHE